VRLEGEPVSLGTLTGEPLATATVQFGPVGAAEGVELWAQHGEVVIDGVSISVDRWLHRRDADGVLVMTGSRGPALQVDPASATITIDDGDEPAQLQLLATFGLPLVLQSTGALIVHGSSCSRGDQTVVICGDSGSGKSSALVGLVDAGWTAVTEDLCAIDFRGGVPTVWPGPPWVRVGRGRPGPAGSARRFAGSDKTGWDLSGNQTAEARPLTQVVLLDAPGGDAPSLTPVPNATAIRALAPHAVWLGDNDERGPRLFGPTAELAAKVPTFRLRLPRRDSWLDAVPDLLASA
jgi:hypothetical protein